MTASPSSVCLIILNYNGRELLERFLPSLARSDYQPLELVVVDNASTDDSVAWLKANWPQVTILSQTQNRYWAGGNNVGIQYALEKGHRYLVFANNDIEPHPAWIREAVRFADTHPQCGLVGFQLFNQESTRPAFEAACQQPILENPETVPQVDGCSLLCRREVIESVGLFDERYLLYADELDFEERALRADWQMTQIQVPVWHLGEASTRRLGLWRAYLHMRNVIRLKLKLEGLIAGALMIKTVLNRAGNPWVKLDFEKDCILRRYRPASLPVSTVLALAAIGWNLFWLPQTLSTGQENLNRIARYRAGKGL